MTWLGQNASYAVKFQSVTRQLVDDPTSDSHQCPHCQTEIDFGMDLEWMGPSAFICASCGNVIELKDLGLD